MPKVLGWKEVLQQSKNVFSQFGESKWIPFAKENAKLPNRDSDELRNIGVGKYAVLAAMGESLEDHIDSLKKYRDRIDIFTCDKGFKPLLERGIKADYVVLCDCNVLYKHIEPVINETKGVKLLATPYANTDWTTKWQGDRYFLINKDALRSEKIFLDIMGHDKRVVPAGSNVSNAMLVYATGSDEYLTQNFMNYEKYLLTGYDYSWRPEGNYYAFSNPEPKRYYMSHRTLLDYHRDTVFTSENLWFSVKWAYSYITLHKLGMINCSDRGLLDVPLKGDMEKLLASISPDKSAIRNVRNQFELIKDAFKTYNRATVMYENLKGGLTI